MALRWRIQESHPPQKFERSQFWSGWSYGIKIRGFEVTFNGIDLPAEFNEIYKVIQNLLMGDTDTQHGDLISLIFPF
jgi:hypothetical protein